MLSRPSVRLTAALAAALLVGAGCLPSSQPATGPDGGVFKTTDRGLTWVQKRVLIQGPKGVSIADDVITSIAFDPQDHNAVYVGTATQGLLYSLDGGDSWQTAGALNKGRIETVAVDPKDKCTVFASQGNKIFKTVDCSRDWTQAWFDPKTDKVFTQIAVDWFNPTIIWAGTSDGDILKSTDAGTNWLVSQRSTSPVSSLVINPKDSRVVYVGTRGDGVWKTADDGNTWQQIKKELDNFDGARRVTQVAVDPLAPDTVFLISKYGIIRSTDAGASWTALALTSPPNSVDLQAFALNPRDDKQLQYVTPNTLLVSSDNGATWTAKKLPSGRIASSLAVDPEDGNTLYVGMGVVPKQ